MLFNKITRIKFGFKTWRDLISSVNKKCSNPPISFSNNYKHTECINNC